MEDDASHSISKNESQWKTTKLKNKKVWLYIYIENKGNRVSLHLLIVDISIKMTIIITFKIFVSAPKN